MNNLKRKEFRKIPVLSLLPESLFCQLKFDEFFLPDEKINHLCRMLERELGCYLMTYKSNFSPAISRDKTIELCCLIKPATITHEQTNTLKQHELTLKQDVIFVAYKKPLGFY